MNVKFMEFQALLHMYEPLTALWLFFVSLGYGGSEGSAGGRRHFRFRFCMALAFSRTSSTYQPTYLPT